jgi:radical SAM enzyme (TIGR01210 family)
MEEKFLALQGGTRLWWDVWEQKLIQAAVLYLAQGCPDWGEKGGKRNDLCSFCALPHAATQYREFFYGSRSPLPDSEHLNLFSTNLEAVASPEAAIHTLMVFNAGSFLAEIANSPDLQISITKLVAQHPTIQRFVIESRAGLITQEALMRLMDILGPAGKHLTIRVGVETQNDVLRLKVLKKGHGRKQLYEAVEIMKRCGVNSGGYVLLNSAPFPEMKMVMNKPDASETEVSEWAMEETAATLDWVLGDLGMDEAYFCSTNVGPDTPLATSWQRGEFHPASLWMVLKVLQRGLKRFSGRIHLLPFRDEPELLAVSSNHVLRGIPQSLQGAQGCDLEFHAMLSRYRESMDPAYLAVPECNCRPEWFSAE